MVVIEVNGSLFCWLFIWQKLRGYVIECIDLSKEKYKGSIDRKLVIMFVFKDDEWRYQVVFL